MEAGLAYSEITSPNPPSRFLLLRDGNSNFTGEGYEDIHLTADGARQILEDFNRQGNAIPIDYHHASLQVEQTKQGAAPAAGWVNDLEYIPGEGLYAKDVEWTDKAAASLQQREFKFWSPVVFRNEDESIYHLHSVALTNRPRTRDMTEILRAAHLAANSNQRIFLMTKKKADKKVLWSGSSVVAGQDDDLGEPVAPGAAPMDPAQVAQIKLMQVLDLGDDATLLDVLNAAIEKLGGEQTEGEGEGEGTAEAHRVIAAALGTKATDPKVIAAEIETLKVQASQAEAIGKRLKAVEASILDKENKERKTVAAALVDEQVEAGRLLPDDEAAMKAAGALALTDPEGFKAIYASMPAIVEPGSVQPQTTKARDQRSKLIAAASLEYDENHVLTTQQCSKESWVNVGLRDARLGTLTADEIKKLA